MALFSLIKQDAGLFYIEGDLNFSSLNKQVVNSFDFLNSASKIIIDLKKVKTADSAGLALIVEWLKYSRLHEVQLLFDNIPDKLQVLAKLGGLDLTRFQVKPIF